LSGRLLAIPEVFCLRLNIGINWLTDRMKQYRIVAVVFQELVIAFPALSSSGRA